MRRSTLASAASIGSGAKKFVAMGSRVRVWMGLLVLFVLAFAPAAHAAGNCPNEAIRVQQGATNLPECRAYELVTPVDKAFGTVAWKPSGSVGGEGPTYAAEWGVTAASPDGSAVTYPSWAAFPGNDIGIVQNYRSRRGPSGWTTKSGSPPLTVPDPNAVFCPCYPFWKGASADLGSGLMINSNSWSPADHNGVGRGEIFNQEPIDAYVRRPDESTDLVSIGASGNAVGKVNQESGQRYNISLDGSGVLFQTASEVVPADAGRPEGVEDVYLNREGTTELVQLRPDGTKVSTCGSGLASSWQAPEPLEQAVSTDRSISADGRSVIFTAPEPGYFGTGPACEEPKRLYVRVPGGEILDVSESQRPTPDPAGTKRPQYVAAAEDASRIFFTSAEMLTADTPEEGNARYLYEYSVAERELHFLLVTYKETESIASVMAVSGDGKRIYFSSGFDFAEGWEPGARNIYMLHEGSFEWVGAGASILANTDGGAMRYLLSPDGRSLLFASRSELTGAPTNEQDQVYLHREGGPLVCLSCRTDGVLPTTDARIALGIFGGAYNESGRFASSLSDDGSSVAFETGESLLPGDRDGGKRDVYLWNEGSLALLTPTPPDQVHFLLGMSGDGRDVFVGTFAPVLAEDSDGGDEDIYDIRVEGGFLYAEAAQATTCGGEACQPPAAAPPSAQRQASAQIQTPGDARQRRAKKRCTSGRKAAKASKNRVGKRRQGTCKPRRAAHRNKGGAK